MQVHPLARSARKTAPPDRRGAALLLFLVLTLSFFCSRSSSAATYTLAVSKAGAGSGSVAAEGVDLGWTGSTGTASPESGTVVTLDASAEAGSLLASWSGCDAVSGTRCTVTMSQSRSVAATFVSLQGKYAVTVAKEGEGAGTVSSAPLGISCGSGCANAFSPNGKVTLTAKPVAGSVFYGWGGACAGLNPKCTIAVLDGPKEVTANFVPIPAFELSVEKTGPGSGTVTALPKGLSGGISCGEGCSDVYQLKNPLKPVVVKLKAKAAADSVFTGWSGACSGTGACAVPMGSEQSVTATFAVNWSKASLNRGAVELPAPLPVLTSVPYSTREGETRTLDGAFSGLVLLYVDPDTPEESVLDAVQSEGGEVVAKFPFLGQYVARVSSGGEGDFLSSMFERDWVENGSPYSPILRGSVLVADWNDAGAAPSDSLCSARHMDGVALVASRRGGSVATDDLSASAKGTDEDGNPIVDMTKIPQELIRKMETGANAKEPQVINLSVQSIASGTMHGDVSSACGWEECELVREQQRLFYEGILKALDGELKKKPAVADRTIINVIAGNTGIDLDAELGKLRTLYPEAFKRLVVVGGTDAQGNVDQGWNHVRDNSARDMVYSRGKGVRVGSATCDGTSFAGPEVASVLDYIWSRNKALRADQVTDAFKEALFEMSPDGRIPQDADGYTSLAFLQRAVEKAGGTLLTYALTTATAGSGTVAADPPGPTYAAGQRVTVTATPAADATFSKWSGCDAVSGPVCTVTMKAARAVTATFTQPPRPTHGVQVAVTGAGAVTSNPSGISCGTDCSGAFPEGAIVTLTEAPKAGSCFLGWGGRCSGRTPSCAFTVGGDESVTAEFVTKFDGGYAGTYTGTIVVPLPDGSTYTDTVSGSVALRVAGGVVTVTVPGSGTGAISSGGNANFSTVGGAVVEGTSCTFSGAFTSSDACEASGAGAWSCAVEGATVHGSWSVARN